MSQSSETSLPRIFTKRGEWIEIDINRIVSTVQEILTRESNFYEAKDKIEEETECEFWFSEYPIIENLAKLSNVELRKEKSYDELVCDLDSVTLAIVFKNIRYVMYNGKTELNIPESNTINIEKIYFKFKDVN